MGGWLRGGFRAAARAVSGARTATTDIRNLPINFEEIARAEKAIAGGVRHTSCRRSHLLSSHTGIEIYIKTELHQATGSFKERGARNALLSCSDDVKDGKGVIAASAGNHALALAWHGRDLDIPVTVVMPKIAPLAKVSKCRTFGANVVLHGVHIGEARDEATSNPAFAGMEYINGYDDAAILAGAGTLGLEIMQDVPDVDAVVIPCGGGGLLAGVGLAIKTLKPGVDVLAVEPENCPSFAAALKAGRPVATPTLTTLADGLAVPTVGGRAFEVARACTDDCVAVPEAAIALAVLRLIEGDKLATEGGGAAGLAALLPGQPLHAQLQGKKVVLPLCGGNIDTTTLGRVLERGLAADGRLCRFVATVSDRPGGIARLTRFLADAGASLKDIYHERAWLQSAVDRVQVRCVIETADQQHADEVRSALEQSRWPVVWGDAATVSEQLEEFPVQPAGQFSTFEPVQPVAGTDADADPGGVGEDDGRSG